MNADNLDVTLVNGRLMIKDEKKRGYEENKGDNPLSERRYGSLNGTSAFLKASIPDRSRQASRAVYSTIRPAQDGESRQTGQEDRSEDNLIGDSNAGPDLEQIPLK